MEARFERFMAAYEEGWADPAGERIADIWAEDCEMLHPELDEPMRGREAVMEYLRNMLALAPDLKVRPLASAASGDTLFVHWRAEGTFNGRKVTWDGADRFELEGDRARFGVGFFDTTAIREAVAGTAGGK